MNGRLPFRLPWVKIHLLIRSITTYNWPEDQWALVRSQLRRAIEIRGELIREAWRWN